MKELTLAASLENIAAVTAFIDEQLETLDCSMKAQVQIDVAIDELFGNIAHYAYPDGTGDATVRFDFDEATRMASITFIDGGVPFDPPGKCRPGRDPFRGGARHRRSRDLYGQEVHGQGSVSA